jgi:hypothetical protein
MVDLFRGPFVGRFFRLSSPVPSGAELLKNALPYAFSASASYVTDKSSLYGYCRSAMPYDSDLEMETAELGYGDAGTGVFRLWIREEERTVGRASVQILARKLAMGRFPGWEDVPALIKKELLSAAKIELLDQALPKIRVVPCAVDNETKKLFVARKVAFSGARYSALFTRTMGSVVRADPLLWDAEDEMAPGWFALSEAALTSYLSKSDNKLDADTSLVEVKVGDQQLRCIALEPSGDQRKVLESVMKLTPRPAVTSLVFHVSGIGGTVEVAVDAQGVYRLVPATSPSGLAADRLRRRFADGFAAVERVAEVLREAGAVRASAP